MSTKPWHNRQDVLSTWETHLTFNGLGGGNFQAIFATQDQFSTQTIRIGVTQPFIILRYAVIFQASGFTSGQAITLDLRKFTNCSFVGPTTIGQEEIGEVAGLNIVQCLCGEFSNPRALEPCDAWQARLLFDADTDQPRGRITLLCAQL